MPAKPIFKIVRVGAFAKLEGNKFQGFIHRLLKKYRSAFKRNEFLYIQTPLFLVIPFRITKTLINRQIDQLEDYFIVHAKVTFKPALLQ